MITPLREMSCGDSSQNRATATDASLVEPPGSFTSLWKQLRCRTVSFMTAHYAPDVAYEVSAIISEEGDKRIV